MMKCCHGSDLRGQQSISNKLGQTGIFIIWFMQCCALQGLGAHFLKDTRFRAFGDTLDGTVAYRLLPSPLVHSRILAVAQDLKETADTQIDRMWRLAV